MTPIDVEQVILEEMHRVGQRRVHLRSLGLAYQAINFSMHKADVYKHALQSDLCGLAISGGGIRSATFGLGIIQGLAVSGLLPRFDYISTVSGGGYIGAWLAKWILREDMKTVVESLEPPRFLQQAEFSAYQRRAAESSTEATGAPSEELTKDEWNELREIRHLRFYSNYLSPRLGMFSADGSLLIAIYLRNLLLNQLVLLFAVLGAFFFVRLLVEAFAIARQYRGTVLQEYLAGTSVIILAIAVAYTLFVAFRARFAIERRVAEWRAQKAWWWLLDRQVAAFFGAGA